MSVLLLVSGRRGDVPIRHLLDDKVFRTFVVLPNVYDPDVPLPPHDIVFNAIGDADFCALALDRAVTLMERTFAPVINSPAAVLGTGRAANARRLGRNSWRGGAHDREFSAQCASSTGASACAGSSRIAVPAVAARARISQRPAFSCACENAERTWRSAGRTSGRGTHRDPMAGCARRRREVSKVSRHDDRRLAVSAAPGHFEHWKIHYVTADMADDAGHRAEEAQVPAGYAGRAGIARDGRAGGHPERARVWTMRASILA